MRILALETATDVGSVALVSNGELEAQFSLTQRFGQSRNLVQAVGFLLSALNLSGAEIGGIAVSIGPGSYTGLRIGLSVAKGLAFGWDRPLYAVNSLDALAQQGRGTERLIVPVIRFRRDEYYSAFFAWDGEEVSRRSGYRVVHFAELLEEVKEPALLVGILRAEDAALLSSRSEEGVWLYLPERRPEAQFVGRLAEKSSRTGLAENAQSLSPFYMHDFPVQKG